MMYKGKNVSLGQYVRENLRELDKAGSHYEYNETVTWLIMDYYGSMGEFSKTDKAWLRRNKMTDVEQLCYEELEVIPN